MKIQPTFKETVNMDNKSSISLYGFRKHKKFSLCVGVNPVWEIR